MRYLPCSRVFVLFAIQRLYIFVVCFIAQVAVCNLASIALPMCVRKDGTFDHQKLYDITYVVTKNLNKIIDVNYYPVPEAERSNMRHRPIGIGNSHE